MEMIEVCLPRVGQGVFIVAPYPFEQQIVRRRSVEGGFEIVAEGH